MSETLSAKSKERVVKWAEMQSGEVAMLITQGASNQRKVDNWQGQKVLGDGMSNRKYES